MIPFSPVASFVHVLQPRKICSFISFSSEKAKELALPLADSDELQVDPALRLAALVGMQAELAVLTAGAVVCSDTLA